MAGQTTLRQSEFLKPKYWLTWFGILLIRSICALPLRGRWAVGSALGYLAYLIAGKRRHIVKTNLRLCFPDLPEDELKELIISNFRSSGMSIIETALVWFTPATRHVHLVNFHGVDQLEAAIADGKGVLLVGMHLSTLDFCGASLATRIPFDVMYRYNKNKLLEAVMTRGRERNFPSAIERSNIRQVIRRLREGAVVWYGPDQDYGAKHSVFAPFFNIPTATISATSRIAEMTECKIVVFSHYRNLEKGCYDIYLTRVDDFPSDSELDDCTRVNKIIEDAIQKSPEQYWWLHRRFKTRPPGEPRPYDNVVKVAVEERI